jgi:hypothetical protein
MSYEELEPRQRRWPRLLRLVAAGVAVAVVSRQGVFGRPPSAALLTLDGALVHGQAEAEADALTYCVVSGAWGDYRSMLNVTRQSKVVYANKWGYRYLEYRHETVSGFATECGACATCNNSVAEMAVAKFCSIRTAFASGCGWVLWIDADNAIFDAKRTLPSLVSRGALDTQQTGAPWAVWGFVTGNSHPTNTASPAYCDPLAANVDCGKASNFGECLNSGVFIMKAGEIATHALNFMLNVNVSAMSTDDDEWNWQCTKSDAFQYNDQCALAYMTQNWLQTTDGYRCLPTSTELDELYGYPLQNYASSYYAETNLTLDPTAFANACVWGSTADKLACTEIMMVEWRKQQNATDHSSLAVW